MFRYETLVEKLQENKTDFYFTDINHILYLLDYDSVYLREITLPNQQNSQMIKKTRNPTWKVNEILLDKKRELANLDTWKYLAKQDMFYVCTNYNIAMRWASYHGYSDILLFLIELHNTSCWFYLNANIPNYFYRAHFN